MKIKRITPKVTQRAPTEVDTIAAAGIALLYHLSTAAGFVFRSLGGLDLGIDAAIEIFDEGRPRGLVLFQIKCTTHQKNIKTATSIEVNKASTLLSYWRSLESPVIVLQALIDLNAHDQNEIYIATGLYAIDSSEESLIATASTIRWTIGSPTELRLANARSMDAPREFRKFILATKSREPAGVKENSLWLSNRALDAADYDAARMAIRDSARKGLPWACIQECRINRREGNWHPARTALLLEKYTFNPKSGDSHNALREIGYSYLVGAMDSWCRRNEGFDSKYDESDYCQKALHYLLRWKNAVYPNWEGHDYWLYALLVQITIEGGSALTEVNRAAEQLLQCFGEDDRDIPISATLQLWVCALVTKNQDLARRYMENVWEALGSSEDELPITWRDRSPHLFANAILLRAWTLLGMNPECAKEIFNIGIAAVRGVLKYREVEFWMYAALQQYPNLAVPGPEERARGGVAPRRSPIRSHIPAGSIPQ